MFADVWKSTLNVFESFSIVKSYEIICFMNYKTEKQTWLWLWFVGICFVVSVIIFVSITIHYRPVTILNHKIDLKR